MYKSVNKFLILLLIAASVYSLLIYYALFDVKKEYSKDVFLGIAALSFIIILQRLINQWQRINIFKKHANKFIFNEPISDYASKRVISFYTLEALIYFVFGLWFILSKVEGGYYISLVMAFGIISSLIFYFANKGGYRVGISDSGLISCAKDSGIMYWKGLKAFELKYGELYLIYNNKKVKQFYLKSISKDCQRDFIKALKIITDKHNAYLPSAIEEFFS